MSRVWQRFVSDASKLGTSALHNVYGQDGGAGRIEARDSGQQLARHRPPEFVDRLPNRRESRHRKAGLSHVVEAHYGDVLRHAQTTSSDGGDRTQSGEI